MAKDLKTMTVRDLKNLLDDYDDDMPVVMSAPSGDYWGSVLALPIDSQETQEGGIRYSEYHRRWKLAGENDDADDTVALILG